MEVEIISVNAAVMCIQWHKAPHALMALLFSPYCINTIEGFISFIIFSPHETIVVKIESESAKQMIRFESDPIFSDSDSDFLDKKIAIFSKKIGIELADDFLPMLFDFLANLAKTKEIPSFFLMPIFCRFYLILPDFSKNQNPVTKRF